MSNIGENSFLTSFLYTIGTATTNASITKVLQSNEKADDTFSSLKKTFSPIVAAVARISPPSAGRIPVIKALTAGYFIRFLISAATISIIINEGSTTPTVARSAPRKPPCS